MPIVADLHLHSRWSRATSPEGDLAHFWMEARKKGIDLLGTGDFTHPAWRVDIREQLVQESPGFFRLVPETEARLARLVPGSCAAPVRFVLTVEIATIYRRDDRTRKVHHLVGVPDFEAMERLVAALGRVGNLASDGRPILGLDSRRLLEMVLECGDDAFLVPAHAWTPWFSVLGAMSGFDRVDDCYGDLASHVFALETGLSSDAAMNRRVSSLDRMRLVSFSDAHSPRMLAREATLFSDEVSSFSDLSGALRTGRAYLGTIEFFPEEGKYHLDGHRGCGLCWQPDETRRQERRCPVCGKPVTVGVLHRVEDLADRTEPASPATAGVEEHLVPLAELLGELCGKGPQSKAVLAERERLLTLLGPELRILRELPLDEIGRVGGGVLAESLRRLRVGEVTREAGFDGQYGTIRVFREGAPTVPCKTRVVAS
jgi:DNA helicase II / ATP-dependent DNA helicase PcrA